MFHWSTDPKLLDETIAPLNQWETANSLIEKSGIASVLGEDLSFQNLYGIMVRKIDFLRKKRNDRILARFPFLVMTDEMIEAIQSKELLLAEATRDYFYKSVNKSILQWRERIRAFLDRGAIPLPIYRIMEELFASTGELPFSFCNDNVPFTSARGETFSFPRRLTRKLAYLCGVCNGDGNLRNYWVVIVDESKEHIKFIEQLLRGSFAKEGSISKLGNAWSVKLTLLWAARLFNFLTDQTINEPKYNALREPLVFKQLGEPFRNLYWRGVFDADGSFKKKLSFTASSKKYINDFQRFLNDIGIESKCYQIPNGFQVFIPARYKFEFAEKIGVSNHKKRADFLVYLSSYQSTIRFKGINETTLTEDGFFDFHLIPSLQVLGLDDFFKLELESLQNQNELKWLRIGKGLTIRKLEELLEVFEKQIKLMFLLKENQEKILFRSGNSKPIKLPLQPSRELERIMSCITPTARGVTIIEEFNSRQFQKELEVIFNVVVNRNKITSKLLSRYLRTFAIYEEVLVNFDEFSLREHWMKSILG